MKQQSLIGAVSVGIVACGVLAACASTPAVAPAPGGARTPAASASPSTAAPTPAAPATSPASAKPAPNTPSAAPTLSSPARTPETRPTAPSPGTAASGSVSLKAGSGHSEAASAWAYKAADVQRWIRTPGKGAQPAKKVAFLTFDDGPTSMTPKVLDALKAKGVHATFFILGSQIKGNESILRRMIAEGHAVAIHSWGHKYSYLYPGGSGNRANIVADWERAVSAGRSALGTEFSPGAYRYPGGHMSWRNLGPADQALASRGVSWIDWNTMTGDAEPASRRPSSQSAMVRMATATNARVSVMLAHDTSDKRLTLSSLPAIIDAYKNRGYSFGIIG